MSKREECAISVDDLAAALDAILTELVEYRLSRPPSSGPIRLIPAMQSEPERRAALIARILDDPFEGALLFTLRGIGEELFALGGTRLMREILHEVAARDPINESRRLSPADSQWDGIGDHSDFWAS